MRKLTLFLGVLLSIIISVCQAKKLDEEKASDLHSAMMGTPDQIYWLGEQYTVNKSFLSPFSGYDKLYPDIPMIEYLTFSGYNPGQKYYPTWLFHKGALYLRSINFYADYEAVKKVYPDYKGQYRVIEELTKQKFQKNLDNLSSKQTPVEGHLGTMKASWVDGIYYMKPIRKYAENRAVWENKPFYKLTFKSGKLISMERVNL